jgi:hypothetical protein
MGSSYALLLIRLDAGQLLEINPKVLQIMDCINYSF